METTKFFAYEMIAEGVTVITGKAYENCYLVEGSKKAVLIDSLSGYGNLCAFCRELTDLPIEVVNTHGHVDHCGGNFDFGECFIHPLDISLLYEHGDVQRRKSYTDMMIKAVAHGTETMVTDYKPPCAIKTFPMYGGNVFDLGNKRIEVIEVAGHTKGSVVLLLHEQRLIFSGDACNNNTLLNLQESVPIEQYRESLLYLKSFNTRFDGMYAGHGRGLVPVTIIDEAIELCDEILNGTDDAIASEFLGRKCFYGKAMGPDYKRYDGKTANIAYSK